MIKYFLYKFLMPVLELKRRLILEKINKMMAYASKIKY